MTISKLVPDDFEDFIALIRALAEFEKLDPPDAAALHRLRSDAFATTPRYEAYLVRTPSGQAVAYCIIFETYSSFLAKSTLYLEDIFVLPDFRKQGIGRTFMRFLVSLAKERGCGRMEWQVLDWNVNAIDIYNKLGATHLQEWFSYRVTEDKFDQILES